MTHRLHLLVSSLSARGRALRAGKTIVRTLRSAGWNVTVHVTRSHHNIAQVAHDSPPGLVGAVGGDGYLAAVGEGLAGLDTHVMVPFPGGRGNDLCRALSIGTDPQQRAFSLTESDSLHDRYRLIDAMTVGDDHRFALGVISMGIDSEANGRANRSWLRSGPLAYAWGAVSAFVSFSPLPFRASFNGEPHDLDSWVCSISNSGWIGGGINVVPGSRLDDGVLEVFQVGATTKTTVVPLLAQVLSGRSLDSPLVNTFATTEVRMEEPAGLVAMADGDEIARIPFTVRVVPDALRILV